MRKLSFILFIFISFAFSQKKEQIKFSINGNPTCLEFKKEYTLTIKFNSKIKKRNFLLSGSGVFLTKPSDYQTKKSISYKIKPLSQSVEVFVHLYEKVNDNAKKLESFGFKICQ